MKKLLFSFLILLSLQVNAQDIIFETAAINPCGQDGQNEYILAQTGASDLNINNLVIGTVQDTLDALGNCNPFVDGSGLYDFNYSWNGTLGGAPINSVDACGGAAMTCNYLLEASDPAELAVIDNVVSQLNTAAACPGLFVSLPTTNTIPSGATFIMMLGAGSDGTTATLDNPNLNLNFATLCGTGPIYVVVGTNLTNEVGFQSNAISPLSSFPCRGYILSNATTGDLFSPIVSYSQNAGVQGTTIDATGILTSAPCSVTPPDVCVMSIAAAPSLCDVATQEYALTLTVDYANVSGESFTINVDGVDYGPYNFVDYPSGSDIVLTGFDSDASVGVSATVAENVSNDLFISAMLPNQDPLVDGNGDGTINFCDEYIEITNSTTSDIDISNYEILDNIGVRHTFAPGTIILAGQTIRLYNTDFIPTPASCTVGIWNNTGDIANLVNPAGDTVSVLGYPNASPGEIILPSVCSANTTFDAPAPCLAACSLTDTGLGSILCDDNGTATDPSDDTYTYTLNPVGSNTSTTYIVIIGASSFGPFNYGSASDVLGPFDISGGNINFTIVDADDALCTISGTATAPSPCSSACDLTAANLVVSACNDNGTNTDPSDDYYTFTVNPTGDNTGSSYNVLIDGVLITNVAYGTAFTSSNQFISAGNLNITIEDADNAGCSIDVIVTAPASCSSASCSIDAVNLVVSPCNDNGTPSIGSDDTYTITINPTASNASANYTVILSGTPTSNPFGTSTTLGPISMSSSPVIVVSDALDATCSSTQTVTPPASCVVLGTVSGIVYVDIDSSGTFNGGENGFAGGVVITLLDDLGNVVATITTGPTGSFSFTGLNVSEEYTVSISTLSGYTLTTPSSVAVSFAAGNVVTLSNVFGLNEIVNSVSLLFFEAKKENNEVLLIWNTINEENNDYFIIQRSKDGQEFQDLSRVDAMNLMTLNTYNTVDTDPYLGYNYYRLISVENNGKRNIEGLKVVYFEDENTLNVFPNPTESFVTLQFANIDKYTITIIDATGKNVYNQIIYSSSAQINMSAWATGTYFVKVENNHSIQYEKILKQ